MIKSTLSVFLASSLLAVSAQQLILKTESIPGSGSANSSLPDSPKEPSGNLKTFEPKQFKSIGNEVIEVNHEVVLVGKMAPDGVNIYEMPLFGGYHKTAKQIRDDEAFLADCDKNFKSREEASLFFSDMGWQYLSEGSREMAIYRFNLASLLDVKNVDVFWGLGVIEYQRGEYESAIKLLSQGLYTDTQFNVTLMVDLATVHIKCFTANKHKADLDRAYKLLDDAILLAPNYANSYMQLAIANLVNGKIDEAWLAFHKGYKIDPKSLDRDILVQLLEQQADPEQLFK